MKDSPFLSGVISRSTASALEAVAKSPAMTFSDMVKLAGLDPKRHLRQANLTGTNLTDSDLRGFDLTGADLRGAAGIRVKWDQSTILENADVGGSIFAAQTRLTKIFADDERAFNLLKSVSGLSWADQAVWAATHLRPSGKHHDIAVPLVEALFYRSTDDFLKAELLRYIAPRMASPVALREMLLAAVSEHADTATLARTVLGQFRRLRLSRDPAVRQIALSLIDSDNLRVRSEAIELLMRTSPSPQEIEMIREKAVSGDVYLRTLFVAETARRLGQVYDLITRDPETNATFPLGSRISPRTRDLIARRWLRAESSEQENNIPLALRRRGGQYQDYAKIAERAQQITSMWEELRDHGVEFLLPTESISPDLTASHSLEETKSRAG